MPKKTFWEIIKDDAARTYEILGLSFDDTALTKLVCDMQASGMAVRCETPPGTCSREQIQAGFVQIGYRKEAGLYQRLGREFRTRGANSDQ